MSIELRRGKRVRLLSVVWTSVVMFVLTACSSGSEDILTQCVNHDNLDGHIHVFLAIAWNGQPETLPANIGITPDCMRPTHTHDDSSLIHIEAPNDQEYTVGDFFDVWGADSPALRPGASVERGTSLNGQPYTDDYQDIVFEDGQMIVVALGNRTPVGTTS